MRVAVIMQELHGVSHGNSKGRVGLKVLHNNFLVLRRLRQPSKDKMVEEVAVARKCLIKKPHRNHETSHTEV